MRRATAIGATLVLAVSAALAGASAATAEDGGDVLLPVPHQLLDVAAPGSNDAAGGARAGQLKHRTGYICTAEGYDASNRRTDCEGNAPDNETTIAVNPTNPRNIIAGANDFQLSISGQHVYQTALSRAMVSDDGGRTWSTYALPWNGGAQLTGDPAIAFDADGRAYYSTLGFNQGQGRSGIPTSPDVLVSTSTDGGRTWTGPATVARGTGNFNSNAVINDKEYMAAWGHGNAIVTWSRYLFGQGGAFVEGPIVASVTHDGGRTWSDAVEISGSAPFCTGGGNGAADRCDQDFTSVPTVTPDGRILVAFENGPAPGSPDEDDQYLVVEVSPATGKRIAGPYVVAPMQDGLADYPVDVQGRQTYQDSQFRTSSAGNITADPAHPGRLAVSWSDMRNSPSLDTGRTDPYTTVTNSDVFVSVSDDYGRTWSAPAKVADGGPNAVTDQWFPWAAYGPDGTLSVTFSDRSYDPANHLYGQTLAQAAPGSLAFTAQQVSTALSDPTRDDLWFTVTEDPAFPSTTLFIGDYNGMAVGPDGAAHPIWTDMRSDSSFGGATGHDETTVTATVPIG
ncbi:MAG: sialidase family protein [Frankiaceae bacterium]